MKKQVKYISAGMLAGMLLCGGQMQAANTMSEMYVCVTDAIQKDNRPEVSKRLFRSNAVEKEILRVQKLLKNEKLAWMFTNCFPNTIDTTVHFRKGEDGKPDTFVYTGDIHAMWLRDSGAQVWPYVQLANSDPELKEMLAALKVRQKLLGGTSFFISCLFLLFRKHSVNLLHQSSKFFRVIHLNFIQDVALLHPSVHFRNCPDRFGSLAQNYVREIQK